MTIRVSRLQFGDAYTDAMADAAHRLRLLSILIGASELLIARGSPKARDAERDAFSIVGQVCRIVAKTWSPTFGSRPYRPVMSRWPKITTKCRLFRQGPRSTIPADFERISADSVKIKYLPGKRMLAENFESMHDAAELLYRRLKSPVDDEVIGSLSKLAKTMHDRLYDALAMHLISLPEWGLVGFLRFEPSPQGGAHWFVSDGASAPDF